MPRATLTQPSWVASPHQYSGKRIADLASRMIPQAQVALVYARNRPGFRVRQERFSSQDRPEHHPDQREAGQRRGHVGDRQAQGVEHARQVEVLGVAGQHREERAEGDAEDPAEGVLEGLLADHPGDRQHQAQGQRRDRRNGDVVVDGEDGDENQAGHGGVHHAPHAAERLKQRRLGGCSRRRRLLGRQVLGPLVGGRHRLLLSDWTQLVLGVEEHRPAAVRGRSGRRR